MGFRFRKSFKIMPGVRVNLSKSGISTSLGMRGARLNLGRKGMRATTGIPGTGISHEMSLSSNRRRASKRAFNKNKKWSRDDWIAFFSLFVSSVLTWILAKFLPSMSWWAYALIAFGITALIAIKHGHGKSGGDLDRDTVE